MHKAGTRISQALQAASAAGADIERLMRSCLFAITLMALACETSGAFSPAPRVLGPSSPPRAYAPNDWGSCADRADPCCSSLAQTEAARAKGDDRTADEQLERLALICPERTKGVL